MNAKANDVNRRGLLKRTAWIGMTAVSVFAMASTASAATYYVSPTGDDGNAGSQAEPFKTIQRALDAITKDNCWKSNIYIEKGTYQLSSELKATANSYTYTIQSVSGDPSDVTIDAQGSSRCFNCTRASEISFKGITFINGSATGSTGNDGNGGGVLATQGCAFDDCVISNCTATVSGGGIYETGDKLKHISNTLVYGCSAGTNGGGIGLYHGVSDSEGISGVRIYNCLAGNCGGGLWMNGSTANMIGNCDISSNTASGANGGGGIYAVNATIRFCTVTNNVCDHSNTSASSTGGSGIRLATTGTIDGCLVKGNSFTYDCSTYNAGGSAVRLASGASLVNSAIIGNTGARSVGLQWETGGGILVSNCLFKSNVARRTDANGRGGLLHVYSLSSDSLITDCRFLENTGSSAGSLVYNELKGTAGATLRIRNCLIAENIHKKFDGLIIAYGTGSAEFAIENCTIVSNKMNGSSYVIGSFNSGTDNTALERTTVSGCAVLFNDGKNAFRDYYRTSANLTYNCAEDSGMSSGNITYDSSKPLFEDLANGNYRPAAGSQLRDIVPSAAWMGDGGKNSKSRDLGTGYEVQPAEAYGVNVVWTDTLPRLSGSAADIGAFEYPVKSGFSVFVR